MATYVRLDNVSTEVDDSGEYGVTERARLVFTGEFLSEVFIEFARHRAGRLALEIEIVEFSSARISLTVSGDGDLIDAFEMACSLGPYDCMVHDVERSDAQLSGRR